MAIMTNRAPRPRLRGFFHITSLRGLDEAAVALPGHSPAPHDTPWRSGEVDRLPDSVILRLGHARQVWRRLRMLHSDIGRAGGWQHRANRTSEGRAPIDRLRPGGTAGLEAGGASLAAAEVPRS